MKKLKVLISAYACGPNIGSEPGVGWKFVYHLAQTHEVHVITEKRKWELPIQEYLEKHVDLKSNLNFFVSTVVFALCTKVAVRNRCAFRSTNLSAR